MMNVMTEQALAVLDVLLRIEDVVMPELIQVPGRRERGFGAVTNGLQKTAVAKRDPVDFLDIPPFIHAGFERDRRQIEICDIRVQSEQCTSPRSRCCRHAFANRRPLPKCITDDAFQPTRIADNKNESDSRTAWCVADAFSFRGERQCAKMIG